MIPFSLNELAAAAGGRVVCGSQCSVDPDAAVIAQVSTDSRKVDAHTLFIPLKGERFDGHDFIGGALEKGACAIASSRSLEELKAAVGTALEKCAVILCEDTLRLMGLSGQLVRRRCHAVTGAITGSCGKTTVKEMTASIMAQRGKTLFTEGNFNNDVGVPLTLLRLDDSYDYAVIEQGASHLCDIARTAEFVEADYALITNAGDAHIEGFGSAEGVFRGKSEILDRLYSIHDPEGDAGVGVGDGAGAGCPAGSGCGCGGSADGGRVKGIGIVPHDSKWIENWKTRYAQAFDCGRLLTFGEHEDATMRVTDIVCKTVTEGGCEHSELCFHLHCSDKRFAYDGDLSIKALGRHNAINAAGAALLALVMGARAEDIAPGIAASENIGGRLTPIFYDGGLTLIDDAYNASFNAVIAAVDTLNAFKGRRIMIFGDMGELGSAATDLHTRVGAHAKGRIDNMLCVGPLTNHTVEAMGEGASHFDSHEQLFEKLADMMAQARSAGQSVTCLVKGSHAMHMDKVTAFIKEYAAANGYHLKGES